MQERNKSLTGEIFNIAHVELSGCFVFECMVRLMSWKYFKSIP